MSKSGRSLMIALLTVSVFVAGTAEAARVGGGRSTGMKRSQVTQNAAQKQAPAPQAAPQAAPQGAPQGTPQAQPNSGPGWGGVAAGVAAGAATGYLVSKAMEPNGQPGAAASQAAVAPQQRSSGIPWGWILLLGGIGLLGAFWMTRRSAARQAPTPAAAGMGSMPAGNAPAAEGQKVYRLGEGAAPMAAATPITRLPDGTESAAFLRQARASFQHIQSLNSPEQLEEVRKYMTPELYEALKAEISVNRDIAEFHELQVDLLDASREDGQLVASVRFSGRVSESLNAPAVPFAEVWHFVRPSDNDPRWVLAGIEQI